MSDPEKREEEIRWAVRSIERIAQMEMINAEVNPKHVKPEDLLRALRRIQSMASTVILDHLGGEFFT